MCFFDMFVILLWIYDIALTAYTLLLDKCIKYLLDRIEEIKKEFKKSK